MCVALCASLQLLRQADIESQQRPVNILCYKTADDIIAARPVLPRNTLFHTESSIREAIFKENRQWLIIHMEVRPPARHVASALLGHRRPCRYDTNNLFSSASIWASSDLCSLSGRRRCAGHGPSRARYAHSPSSPICHSQHADPTSSRPSTRHVLSSRIGTASRCPAVQYWRAS